MSLVYRIMYRVGFIPWDNDRIPAALAEIEDAELVARFAGWRLVSAQPDRDGEISGPLCNVPRTWYRLVRG